MFWLVHTSSFSVCYIITPLQSCAGKYFNYDIQILWFLWQTLSYFISIWAPVVVLHRFSCTLLQYELSALPYRTWRQFCCHTPAKFLEYSWKWSSKHFWFYSHSGSLLVNQASIFLKIFLILLLKRNEWFAQDILIAYMALRSSVSRTDKVKWYCLQNKADFTLDQSNVCLALLYHLWQF